MDSGLKRAGKTLRSANVQGQRLKQCLDPVPSNLHTDTNQEKRRELYDHRHRRCSQESCQAVSKSIAQEYAESYQQASNQGSQNSQRMEGMTASSVRAEGDRHGN